MQIKGEQYIGLSLPVHSLFRTSTFYGSYMMDTWHHLDSGRGPGRTTYTWAVDEQSSMSIGSSSRLGESKLWFKTRSVATESRATEASQIFSFVLNMEIVTTFLEKST